MVLSPLEVSARINLSRPVLNSRDFGRHFIDMTEDGVREGWTTMNSPGATQINAGEDSKQRSKYYLSKCRKW